MSSRLLPLALATAALAAGGAGFGGLAVWLGLLAVPAAAAVAFVAVSDLLEGKAALLRATTTTFALVFIVLESAVRSNAAVGATAPRLATWALLAALFAYSLPAVAWVLEPVKVTRRRESRPRAERRRRRPAEVEEVFSRAA